MKVPATLCVTCKGTKKLCGLNSCPILRKINAQMYLKKKITKDVFGPSQDVFIGSYGYPHLSFGPLVGVQEKPVSPAELYGKSYDEIISSRAQLLRGKKFVTVGERMRRDVQEVAMSIKPIDVEVNLSKDPVFDMKFSTLVQPMGPSAPMKRFLQADNPKIPKKVDSVSEGDTKASDAISELSRHGFDSYYITNIFSAGVLGQEEKKKIVPTKWSITAIDDIRGKQLMDRIRYYPEINEIMLYSNEFLDNHFEVLLIPGKWEFENFESWSPNSVWAKGAKETVTTEEYESFWGRTTYAESQVGGYYASRIGVVEHLNSIRRQARVVVFREIGEGYIMPVGVFAVRETARNAFRNKPMKFQTLSEALSHLSKKLKVPIKNYLSKSGVLQQTRLNDF